MNALKCWLGLHRWGWALRAADRHTSHPFFNHERLVTVCIRCGKQDPK